MGTGRNARADLAQCFHENFAFTLCGRNYILCGEIFQLSVNPLPESLQYS